MLLLGAVYCLLPVAWVLVAATKSRGELFTTFTFAPGDALFAQHRRPLRRTDDGIFWQWMANTALYAGVGALLSAAALRPDRLHAGEVPVPRPDRDLQHPDRRRPGARRSCWPSRSTCCWPSSGLANTYWAVLLPSILSPYGIYLARIYAAAAIPDALLEAGRTDGAGECRIFGSSRCR